MVRRQGFLFGCYATNLLNRHEVILRELLHFCRFERNLRDLEASSVLGKMENLGDSNLVHFSLFSKAEKSKKRKNRNTRINGKSRPFLI